MKENFYDIESLTNVFTLCNFRANDNIIDCYHLIDDDDLYQHTLSPQFHNLLQQRILQCNDNFDGNIQIFDLRTEQGSRHMMRTFGLSDSVNINNPNMKGNYPPEFRLVCDTDPNYDPDVHPYYFGYNSYNYDTSMLAEFGSETFRIVDGQCQFTPTSARSLRGFNDLMFDQYRNNMPTALTITYDAYTNRYYGPNYKDPRWRIRKAMLMSGRHIDVARLNEKLIKVALKRLLGMLGYQILESDKLDGDKPIRTLDELLDLFGYNASDVINLHKLFHHKFYQGQFSLKSGLLKTYPELIYEKQPDKYAPNIDRTTVRRDRLTIDSSSAQFATKALCPYGHLTDIPTVSFIYPSDRKCEELRAQGIAVKQINVLEESRKFFYKNFSQYPDICQQFDKIYNYYKSLEGKNFNDSDFYREDYSDEYGNLPSNLTPVSLKNIPKDKNCLYYFTADGKPSNCFITFSVGGIHGAEFNKALFEDDVKKWKQRMQAMDKIKKLYPDPLDLRKARKVTIDGTEYKWSYFIRSNVTLKSMEAMSEQTRKSTVYRDFEAEEPVVFKPEFDEKTNMLKTYKLNKRYVYTSAVLTNHEDFKSYYPNLLRMLTAFWNEGLGTDRYGDIFFEKERYGKLMKDKTLPDEERDLYAVKREGTKLVLNSASGGADTKGDYKSPIQMNNIIISMRIIGQLFTWHIGQAQTLKGAAIPSTNTDGLYSVMEETINNLILEEESKEIGVEIEPEPLYLISKDTNNRLEMDPATGKILATSGGSLACYNDTNPTKSLAHPAIIDWALSEYLIVSALNYKGLNMHAPFDDEIGRNILMSAHDKFEPAHLLRMYQNVLASSIGSMNYIFGTTDDNASQPIIMQHYNRTFVVKKDTPNAIHLHAANAKVITPAMAEKRRRNKERSRQHDPIALSVLSANNVKLTDIPATKEAVVKSITNVSRDWYMLVENHSVYTMTPQRQQEIIHNLDYELYLGMLRDEYTNNWKNILPET